MTFKSKCYTNNNLKGQVKRMNCNANKSIGCTVHQCQYHCGSENYCTLEKINVGTHESQPSNCQCTDCESFKAKQ